MADDKTTPNATGQVDGDDGQTDGDTGDDGGDDDDTGDNGSIVFESQDALDDWLETRLARDRRSRRRKAKSGAGDKGKTDDKGDDEPSAASAQLQSDALKLVEAANRKAVEASALVAATEAGLPADRIRAAVKLADLTVDEMLDDTGSVDDKAVKSAINDAVKTYSFLKVADNAPAADADDDTPPPKGKVGGKTPKPDDDKALNAITPDRFAELGYQERVNLFNRDPQLYERLANAVA